MPLRYRSLGAADRKARKTARSRVLAGDPRLIPADEPTTTFKQDMDTAPARPR